MKTACLTILALMFALAGRAVAEDKTDTPKEEPVYKDRTLSEWVQQYKTGDIVERQGAVWAYMQMGKAAVPYLTEALTDPQVANCRSWAAHGLGRLGKDAKAAVPQLEITIKDEDPYVRCEAASALWNISEHKAAVPTLIELVKDKDASVRHLGAEALERIGPKAKDAVPTLIDALKDTGQAVSSPAPGVTVYKPVSDAAAKALKKIDPEAAKKAGIE